MPVSFVCRLDMKRLPEKIVDAQCQRMSASGTRKIEERRKLGAMIFFSAKS